jgi:hypothetical protein
MKTMSDIFDLMREEAAKNNDVTKQLSFEERVVKRLLAYAQIPLLIGKAKAEAKQKYGHTNLGFEWFREEYPRFPLTLMAQKLNFTHKTTLADIYGKGRFKKLGWWQEYIDQSAIHGVELSTERSALVFNLPHAQDAFLMVLHNQPSQVTIFTEAEQREEPWPRTTFPIGKTGIVAVLESFPSFLQTVGTEWAE